jgi:hypothetical protein
MPHTDEVHEALDRAETARARYLSISSWRFFKKARAAREWSRCVEDVEAAEQRLWQVHHPTSDEP